MAITALTKSGRGAWQEVYSTEEINKISEVATDATTISMYPNAKKAGSSSGNRYHQRMKTTKTIADYFAADDGKTRDWSFDLKRGFIQFPDEVYKKAGIEKRGPRKG